MKRREAFTLIEMLIVITVIGILAGISFKLVRVAKRNSDRAATVAKLEQVSHALNEFKAEYGIYPPVSSVAYEYENTNMQPSWLCNNYFVDHGDENGDTLFRMGLVSYLIPRGSAYHDQDNVHAWIPDTERDKLAKERWSVFLSGVISGSTMERFVDGTPYANSIATIRDSWGNQIKYECKSPYLSYRLWSGGPTGAPEDDLHRDKWDN